MEWWLPRARKQKIEVLRGGRRDIKGQRKPSVGDRYVRFLDCSESFVYMNVCKNVSKLYTLNKCSLLYINYTSIKLVSEGGFFFLIVLVRGFLFLCNL